MSGLEKILKKKTKKSKKKMVNYRCCRIYRFKFTREFIEK